ncbi:hypothetical protein [Niallia taxi]|uniref:hypothetical protein n=1 Tax=Niallia taxi TaxID=2499688 RepID=UPI0021A26480|nr:hypothetical protein [Niallia taxi]MCT2347476.1 hypothetical protein [Niallia taxi]
MTNKSKLIFIGLFVVLPLFFLIGAFVSRALIQGTELSVVFGNTFGILGIYYVLISVIFIISSGLRNVNLKNL